MPPRSPLPQRLGLDAAWLRTPDLDHANPFPWSTMGDWLHERLREFIDVPGFLAEERFVYESGASVVGADPYQPHTFVWFHRDLSEEIFVPGHIHVVHRDERIVVIDKPAFLSTIPRGRHVQQSVVVRLRAELGLPELSPLHRLDRVTSGVLILATEKRWRGAYQSMFQRGEVGKTYHALAALRADLELPVTVLNHLAKQRGQMQADVVPGARANAESLIELESVVGDNGIYRLSPRTGRTHQLRMHMLGLGIPISGDPLYPVVQQVSVNDFTTPLQLLASAVAFTDPIDGGARNFESVRSLPLHSEVE
ncbi:pseudouridine synthase [Glaciibacter psychrotolerans]|uniref:RNA pseudouridylate synthase n=1 Tax=Glaciibacter psychrotolerans TaxID=670054 RepID=A0A7Z0ECI8_9MICO|nr:tRNA pseudouridine32 synthase/23S rRNA pseudouridine746 synthase [Leifsonia psychrotolerans]